MIVKQFRASGNKRIPSIVNFSNRYISPYVLIYHTQRLEYLSYKTALYHLNSIMSLYEMFEKNTNNYDLDNLIYTLDYKKILNVVNTSISVFLINKYGRTNQSNLSKKHIELYLKFIITLSNQLSIDRKKELLMSLESTMKFSFSVNFKQIRSQNENILTGAQLKQIQQILDPNYKLNPFPSSYSIRVRNSIIFKILTETGIRLGELLLLQCTSFFRQDDRFFVKINATDFEDPRFDKPSIKNIHSARIIEISQSLFYLVDDYIISLRSKFVNSNQIHNYLITTTTCSPLSKPSIDKIIKTTQKAYNAKTHSNKPINISTHSFRHTVATQFMHFLVNERECEIEKAKDLLRAFMGWSVSSTMPLHYANTFFNEEANKSNIFRISSSYGQL